VQQLASLAMSCAALLSACDGGLLARRDTTELGATPAASAATEVADLAAAAEGAAAPACGDGALTDIGRDALARLPYLQRLSQDSVAILFTTRAVSEVSPQIELHRPGGESLSLVEATQDPAASDGLQRIATLSGLEPDTEYCYSIAGWSEPTALHTAPRPGSGAPLRFVVFGDSGTGGEGQLAIRDLLGLVRFELMLHTGDIAYEGGSLPDLERTFFEVYQDYLRNVPAFPVSGNHDYRTAAAAAFRQAFALPDNGGELGLERWYSFDFGDVHFVALDTEWELQQQAEWLDVDLSQNQLPWTIVYLHRPPFSSGYHGGSLAVRDAFVPLFEHHHVQLVLAGHDHDYERTLPIQGVTYVVTGGGGRSTRPVGTSDFTAFSEEALHFVQGTLDGDALTLRAIDATGQQIDSVTLTR
jgi:predicted phosphohydrolase